MPAMTLEQPQQTNYQRFGPFQPGDSCYSNCTTNSAGPTAEARCELPPPSQPGPVIHWSWKSGEACSTSACGALSFLGSTPWTGLGGRVWKGRSPAGRCGMGLTIFLTLLDNRAQPGSGLEPGWGGQTFPSSPNRANTKNLFLPSPELPLKMPFF